MKTYTADGAAKRLRRNPDLIRRWLKEGRLEGQKSGRDWLVPAAEIARLRRDAPQRRRRLRRPASNADPKTQQFIEGIFMAEVETQCSFALNALADAQARLATHDTDRFWCAIQQLLVSAGNVSRLLWPISDKRKARGDALRNALGVDSASPLADRTLRDHFEHFDERIDGFAEDISEHGVPSIYMDRNIGGSPEGFAHGPGLAARGMRYYDRVRRIVYFGLHKFELDRALVELARLRDLAGRLKYPREMRAMMERADGMTARPTGAGARRRREP
jgi:hypothetical protein